MEENIKIAPLYDNVIMEQIVETKTKSGLEIPKSAQEKVLVRAKVLAVGPGKLDVNTGKSVAMSLKAGDTVYINSYFGMKVRVDARTEYIIQKEEEIRAKELAQ